MLSPFLGQVLLASRLLQCTLSRATYFPFCSWIVLVLSNDLCFSIVLRLLISPPSYIFIMYGECPHLTDDIIRTGSSLDSCCFLVVGFSRVFWQLKHNVALCPRWCIRCCSIVEFNTVNMKQWNMLSLSAVIRVLLMDVLHSCARFCVLDLIVGRN